ncbi:hypothetical protein ABPG77_007006 [Micractinium sp. CCAP 211/92]
MAVGPAVEDEGEGLPSAAALQNYEHFRQRLQADLAAARALRAGLLEQQQQYAELQDNIALLQQEQLQSLTTLVPLGAGLHAQATVPDTSRIYVHVGLGFHPELTLDEATAAAAAQRQHLQGQIDARTTELASILAHLRLVEQTLADLEQLRQQGMDQ